MLKSEFVALRGRLVFLKRVEDITESTDPIQTEMIDSRGYVAIDRCMQRNIQKGESRCADDYIVETVGRRSLYTTPPELA